MTIHRRWWWIGGAVLIGLTAPLYAVAPTSQLTEVLFVFSILWLLASSVVLMWWLWRWMTYRVGVRLSITYLLPMVSILHQLYAKLVMRYFILRPSFWQAVSFNSVRHNNYLKYYGN